MFKYKMKENWKSLLATGTEGSANTFTDDNIPQNDEKINDGEKDNHPIDESVMDIAQKIFLDKFGHQLYKSFRHDVFTDEHNAKRLKKIFLEIPNSFIHITGGEREWYCYDKGKWYPDCDNIKILTESESLYSELRLDYDFGKGYIKSWNLKTQRGLTPIKTHIFLIAKYL